MWTPGTRAQHTHVAKRYQTDLSDAEWRLIAAFLPEARSTGRRREWPMREIVNAIFYVQRGGITWRLLPKDFPPWQTVYRWFARLCDRADRAKVCYPLGVIANACKYLVGIATGLRG